jgi:hypothetical protein
LVVDLSNTNAALVTVPASITVPEGATQATFTGNTGQVFSGTVKIWASWRDGAGRPVALKVKP